MYENLKVYRGTTFDGSIRLTDISGKPFLISQGDQIIFGVKKKLIPDIDTNKDPEDVLTKILTCEDEFMGEYPFKFTPDETKLPKDKYYYYVAVRFVDGDYYQVAPYSLFEVKLPIALSYHADDNKITGVVPRKMTICHCNKEEINNE